MIVISLSREASVNAIKTKAKAETQHMSKKMVAFEEEWCILMSLLFSDFPKEAARRGDQMSLSDAGERILALNAVMYTYIDIT